MIIDRYIARAVIQGALLAMLILLAVFAFIDFVGQLDDVGQGDYTLRAAFLYVLLMLPQRLYELSPSILLLGGMISLGAMAASSELIVMRAAGISPWRMTRSVLQAGLLFAISVALLGEYAVPAATLAAKTLRAEAIEKKLIVGGGSDIWARDGNRYVNVGKGLPDHRLRQIRFYELDDKRRLRALITAEQARYVDGHWVVTGIHTTDLQTDAAGSPQTTVRTEARRIMPRLILLELFSVLELEATDMSASELYVYSRYLENNRLDAGEYRLAFWIKVLTPLTCLAMLLAAMPLVLSITPRSGGVGQRIVFAVLIGIVFFVVSRTSNYLGLASGLPPFLSASLPLFLVVALGVYFLQRLR